MPFSTFRTHGSSSSCSWVIDTPGIDRASFTAAVNRVADSDCFEDYRVIHTADGEEACANAIRFNDLVVMPAGFPRTRDSLDQTGYQIVEIGNSEAAKLDGGLSCMSLRF